MNQIPAFHPDWLVTFWLTNPLVNWMDPHLVLALLTGVILYGFYRKRKKVKQDEPDHEEKQFQHLLLKKNIIEKQMLELEDKRAAGDISTEQYETKKREYQKHLEQANKNLMIFTK